MINAEIKLSELITELQGLKAKAKNNVVSTVIVQLQKFCASNIYKDASLIEVTKNYNFLRGFIACGDVSKKLSDNQVKFYDTKLEEGFNLINQIFHEIGYLTTRPQLDHIESHCNSSIALALSFIDRWSRDMDRTHGSTGDFDLYVINSPHNKDQVFQSSFGMATLKLIQEEIKRLEVFESLDLHSHIK